MIEIIVLFPLLCFYIQIDAQTPSPTQTSSSAYGALDQLRGRNPFTVSEIKNMAASAKSGVTYPALTTIPQTAFICDNVKQAGFYADPDTGCQVYRRCEPGIPMTSYLCPAGTIFNQIALTCDFWYNVQCSKSQQFNDFSNPRIYLGPNVKLLDSDTNSTSQSIGTMTMTKKLAPVRSVRSS